MSYSTEGDLWRLGGKPNPGTRKDRRLKRNRKRKARSKVGRPVRARGRGTALQGFTPIPVQWRHGG